MMDNLKNVLFLLPYLVISCAQPEKSEVRDEEYLIAYNVMMTEEGDDYDVWIMDPKSGDNRNLTNNPDVAWTYHSTPDKILFVSDRDTAYRHYFLWEMDVNGQSLRQVSELRLRDSWMGTRKNGSEYIVNPHPSVDSAFHILDSTGQTIQRVTVDLPYATDPTFSPDGKSIAFRGGTSKSKRDDNFEGAIYTVNPDGTELTKVTTYPPDSTAPWYVYKAGVPRFHPIEDLITYQSFRNGRYDLYGVTTDGSSEIKIFESELEQGWHSWSPDGKWLAVEMFNRDQTQFHIGLLDWDTKEFRILTDTTHSHQQAPVFLKNK